jgi:hypothetical protein
MEKVMMRRICLRNLSGLFGLVAFLLLVGMASSALADTTIYESIPSPLPGNVASEGPEAYAFSQIGDAVTLGTSNATLTTVRVVLSDWACTSGHWTNPVGSSDSCMTTPGAKFSQPITMNIYALNASSTPPSAGSLLGTVTSTFNVPYRPSSDGVHCGVGGALGGDGEEWYSPSDNACYHGIATTITFDFSSQHIALPSQVVVGVQYNTTHFGPNPIGQSTTCYANDNNCPYDSLNVSTDGQVYLYPQTPGTPPFSEVFDPNGIFFNYTLPGNSCNGAGATAVFQDDDSNDVDDNRPLLCWTGYHPEIEINGNCSGYGNGYENGYGNGFGDGYGNQGCNANNFGGHGFGGFGHHHHDFY